MKLPTALQKLKTKDDLKDIPLADKLIALAHKYADHKLGMAEYVPPTSKEINDLQKIANIIATLNEDGRRQRADERLQGDNNKEVIINIEGQVKDDNS